MILLFTDALLMLAELATAAILLWWITTSGGINAIAVFSAAIAIATFTAMPIGSPLADRYCKATQMTRGAWVLGGISMGALYLGVMLGSLFGSRVLVDRFGRYRVRIGFGFLEGIALAGAGFASNPVLMVAALATAGFCNSSMGLVGASHRALAIPNAFRIRLAAASSMTTQVAGAIGPAIAGIALSRWSVDAV